MNALEMAQYIACTMYTSEFCCVCGCAIVVDEPKITVLTDVGGNKVPRSAHQNCSSRQTFEKTQAYLN
jgi:hypothetical protein